MRRTVCIWFLLLAASCFLSKAQAQNVALKTNLISDAALSPNLGVEVGLAPKWSLDISGQMNLWTINNHKWKHWLVQPEARYWFCRRFAGHFLGIEAHGGQYNAGNINLDLNMLGTDFRKLRHQRVQGWFAGGGITYGYAWPVHPHWNIEAEIGIGYSYTRYDSYPCNSCGTKIDNDRVHNYVGPTKAAINIVYLF
ncbi:MAG: DUF3575 domain-containing protein [Muribaculaceae bacterium]